MQRSHPLARNRFPRITTLMLTFTVALILLGCDGGSNPDATSSSAGVGSTGGGSTGSVAVCGNGNVETGEQCDDGNVISGDGCSQSCQTEVPSGTGDLEVRNVQAIATAAEGATLTTPTYTVPEDGLLLVRIGAAGSVSQSVTFNGENMIHVSSMEVTYFTSISVEMFYLPVTAGESGAIEVDYGFGGTDAKGIIAATLVGVDSLDSVQTYTDGEINQENRSGPNLAQYSVSAPNESIIVSVFTDYGSGIPAIIGLGHLLDAHPTVPESVFHETKVMAGHVIATVPGNYSLGYQNTSSVGFMDYVMIVASFSRTN